ncbi:MAG: DUF4920 domain-containing protein [Bacteroidota bacterium]
MKKLVQAILVVVLVFVQACSSPFTQSRGEEIDTSGAIDTEAFLKTVNGSPELYKVRGVALDVCQKKGCWMTLKNEANQTIRVTFKDYGFFVPVDISGKEVIVEGLAQVEVIPEADARHYAEDAGQPFEPEMQNSVSFVADGVLFTE